MSTALSVRKDPSRRIVAVTELFDHIGGENKIYRALAASGRLPDFYDMAQGHFARGIERRLKRNQRLSAPSGPRTLRPLRRE